MSRTIVISDAHIPRPGKVRAAACLRPLVEACDRLLVNGDLAETHEEGSIDEANRQIELLRSMAEHASTELLLLSGNHDPLISPWRAAEFAGGRILVTHGDALHPTIAPWAKQARQIEVEWNRIQTLYPAGEETLNARFDSVRAAALAEWNLDLESSGYSTLWSVLGRPNALVQILQHWRRFPQLARSFAEKFFPRAEWILVGHTHRQRIDRTSSPTVINTGAFGFPTRPLAVVLEQDTLEVLQLKKTSAGWSLDGARVRLSAHVENANQLGGLFGPPPLTGTSERNSIESAEQTDLAAS